MSLERASIIDNSLSTPKLKRLIMQLTAKCNSDCYFCMNGGTKTDVTPFKIEDYKNVISNLISSSNKNVQLESIAFTGGEPLIEKENLLDIALFNQSKGLKTMLVSNAILMNSELAKELYSRDVTISRVSLDTYRAEEYDSIRGVKDGFTSALNGIKLMLDAGIKVIIRFTLTKKNLEDVLDTYRLCNSLGVSEFQIRVVSPHGRGNANYMPSLKETEKAYNDLFAIEDKVPITTPCLFLGPCTPAKVHQRMKPCPCAREWLYVTIDGTMYPCNYFPDESKIGNFYKDDINSIWATNIHLKEIRGTIPKECQSCTHWDNCYNQCQGLVYTLTGEFNKTCFNAISNVLDYA